MQTPRHSQERLRTPARAQGWGLPPLPVAEGGLKGVFAEREFIAALFPGYLKEVSYAGLSPSRLDEAIETRGACGDELVAKHMNTEHIDVAADFPDARTSRRSCTTACWRSQWSTRGTVRGVITRGDFIPRSRSAS